MTSQPPTFYSTIAANQVRPYMAPASVMVTATSYWSYGQRRSAARRADGRIPPVQLPAHIPQVAADSGGFQAALRNDGRYPFSFEAYLDWLETIPNLTWAALPDLPCEAELASDRAAIRERQNLTLDYARLLWGDSTEHSEYASVPWAWVPTVQGREPADYVWMAEQLGPLLVDQMLDYQYSAYGYDWGDPDEYDEHTHDLIDEALHGAAFHRVGIGSLCHRAATSDVVAIVRAVADVLPTQRFHLWGVKLDAIPALATAGLLDKVISLDSSAWNGRLGPRDRAANKASGLSQAAYAWQVAHPAYLAKINAACLTQPAAAAQLPLPLAG